MADGIIRFSGATGGYSWLIVVEHPQADLCSLYGHLSPSRWKLKAGIEVKRADLIGVMMSPPKQKRLAEHLVN